jgi:hypothetical protein
MAVGAGLVATGAPAYAAPSGCSFNQRLGMYGIASGICSSGTGLYWVQGSCGTSSLNPVYVVIGTKHEPGSNRESVVTCGDFGACYLIGAALITSG